MRRLALVLVVVISSFASACSSNDGANPAANTPEDQNASTEVTDGGESNGSGTVDSDFEISAPGGADLVLDGIVENIFQADYSAERYDEIVAFYEQWIEDQGVPWLTIAVTSEVAQWLSDTAEGEPQYGWSITVGPGRSDDVVSITLATPDE